MQEELIAIRDALLRNDHLKALHQLQALIDKESGRTLMQMSDDDHWTSIQDKARIGKKAIQFVDAEVLAQEFADCSYALEGHFPDDTLWDAMSRSAQEEKAREVLLADIDLSALRELVRVLEG